MNREKLIYQFRLSFNILKKYIQERFDELKLGDRGYILSYDITPSGYRVLEVFEGRKIGKHRLEIMLVIDSKIVLIGETTETFMVKKARINTNMKKTMDDMMMFIDSFFDELEPEKPKWEPCKWAN